MPDLRPLLVVIDDEADALGVLEYNLRRSGFEVATAERGEEGLRLVRETRPALVLLDVMLPDRPGTELCRQLKSDPATASIPIILVTARTEEIDRVVGFELGADDYVTKPYSVRELVLRVRAVLRRSEPARSPEADPHLRVGPIVIDTEAHRAWVDGRDVSLTAIEFRLLSTLMSRQERVQSREVLLRDVWGLDAAIETRTVDAHVKRLREKLGAAGALVETVRGVGYRLSIHGSGDG